MGDFSLLCYIMSDYHRVLLITNGFKHVIIQNEMICVNYM